MPERSTSPSFPVAQLADNRRPACGVTSSVLVIMRAEKSDRQTPRSASAQL